MATGCWALGLTGVAGFQTCVYIALQTTPALNALLFLSLTPAVIVVLSWLFLRERLALRQGAGILVSLLGAALLITQGDLGVLAGMELRRGDLWMMLAVLLWAVYSLLARRRPAQLSQLGFLSATVLAGMVVGYADRHSASHDWAAPSDISPGCSLTDGILR